MFIYLWRYSILRNKTNKHLGIEIDPSLHYKLRHIADFEGRSINKQVLHLIRQCIIAFEAQNGEILVPKDSVKNSGM